MELNDRNTDSSARLRLVDVRLRAGEASLHFGGGLAGVYTTTSDRSSAAQQIVATVMGPRPVDTAGSVDINGRVVSVHSLPPLPLPPSAPAVLDRDDLSAHWHALCARRRGDLAATHASRRLERYRIAAALDRARAREAGRREPAEPQPWSHAVTVDQTHPVSPADAAANLRAQIRALMQSIDSLSSMPSPEALALADAWDAHTELLRARAAAPPVDLAQAEERVKQGRMAVAMSSGSVSEESRDRIDRCHQEVVEAEARLFEARRKTRPEAVARYEAAVAAEHIALEAAGVDSYSSFLVAIAGRGPSTGDGSAEDDAAAQRELVDASAALDAARREAGVTANEDLFERGVELRAHAERLLGRVVVGGDPPAELRAFRIEAPSRNERVRELIDVLQSAGVVRGDAIKTARDLLAAEPAEERAPGWGVVEGLEEDDARHGRVLAELETEIARLDGIYDADIGQIGPEDLAQVIESLLDAYRAGNLLGGRLPVVLDGAFDGVPPEPRDAAIRVLSRNSDVQSIIVTDDLDVMKSLTAAGGTIVLWPESAEALRGGSLGRTALSDIPSAHMTESTR
ncbi:MAG TPA: hypothetical protein VL769_05065 [Acidimicrobiia bacterium]|nr:hypothetical protein [Acidimicrobiia bacterium]